MEQKYSSEGNGRIRSIASRMVQINREQILGVIRDRELQQFYGTGVYCPVCHMEFSSFAPAYRWAPSDKGDQLVVVAEAGRCPNCDSLERHRLLWKFLHEKTNLFSGNNITLMEIAPDMQFYNLFRQAPGISYYPCDINPDQEKYRKFATRILQADICKLTFDDNFFDVILCCHVMEHVEDDIAAMKELFRVLKSGGWAVIQSPVYYQEEKTFEDPSVSSPEEKERLFGQSDHLRKYGRDYKSRIEGAGFNVLEFDFVKSFHQEEIIRFGFDPYEKIYLCIK